MRINMEKLKFFNFGKGLKGEKVEGEGEKDIEKMTLRDIFWIKIQKDEVKNARYREMDFIDEVIAMLNGKNEFNWEYIAYYFCSILDFKYTFNVSDKKTEDIKKVLTFLKALENQRKINEVICKKLGIGDIKDIAEVDKRLNNLEFS